jgi:signal transduction histidine kinase
VAWWKRESDSASRQRERETAALDIHDNIVQGLAEVQMALDVGRTEQARDAVDRTMAQARRIVTDLMGAPAPGDLRRHDPADHVPER